MKLYIVSATLPVEGVILLEVFDDEHNALEFQVNGVKDQILSEYGEIAANHKDLSIGYHLREMHS